MTISTLRQEIERLFRPSTLPSSVCGLLVVLAVSSIAMSQPSAERLPLPTNDAARQVIAEIRDVFREEYATANTPLEKSALAKELAATAEKNANPLERWGMLSEAGRLAADAGDVEMAFAVVASLAKSYDADRMTLELEAISRMAPRATLPVARDLATRTIALGRTLVSNQAFDEARKVADIMPKLLVKARDHELSAEFREFNSSIDSQIKAAEERAEQEQAFARKLSRMMRLATESADDPDACLEAGLFFCFEVGDWETGLPLLANSSDKELASVVQSEAETKDVYQLYEAADQWAAWAEKQKDDRKAPALDRSIFILTNLTTLTTGLDKIRIEKRLDTVRKMRASCTMPEANVTSGAAAPHLSPHDNLLDDNESLPMPTIQNGGDSVGAWDEATRTLSNSVVGTSNSYPRFTFPVTGVEPGKRYLVKGRLAGGYGNIIDIRLSSNSMDQDAVISFAASLKANNGEFEAVVTSGPRGSGWLRVTTDGRKLFSVSIEHLRVREHKSQPAAVR